MDADPKTITRTCNSNRNSGDASRFQNHLLEITKDGQIPCSLDKERYLKKKKYRYKHYSLGFPVRINEKIEPNMNKDFKIDDIAAIETTKKENINITLSRDKPTEQTPNQKPEQLISTLGKRPPQ